MTDLSPQAQAVLDAFRAVPDLRDCPSIAAALRAAALYCTREKRILMAIAAELEGGN
jgi:hypothetical protein